MPDPLDERRREALWTARYNLKHLDQTQAYFLCEMAEAYMHFATHPAKTESVIKQLRELRRAIRHDPWFKNQAQPGQKPDESGEVEDA
jgi:hypothetical protein